MGSEMCIRDRLVTDEGIELLTVTADGTVPADVFALAPVGAL